MRARWQRLRCKGLLGVWAVFLLMAAMLFAERSGIRTRLQRPGRSYLTGETTLTAAQVMRELPVTCLLVKPPNRMPPISVLSLSCRVTPASAITARSSGVR